jgi:splicing suppressor protein 51
MRRRQPYCRTCHRGVLEIRPPTTLNPCPVCHLVFTCSSCTSSHQLQECRLFETIGNVETFAISHFELVREGEVKGVGTSSPRSSYHPISTINSWYEYFTRMAGDKMAVAGLVNSDFGLNQTFLQSLHDERQRLKAKARYYFCFMGTARLSMAISILAALEKSTPDLSTRQTLSISLTGAGGMEAVGLWVFEELLHLLPALQTLNIMSIGPANKFSPSFSSDGKGDVMECKNCAECVSSNKRRFWGQYSGLYHDYVNTSYCQKPDLAVLFHSGRAESAVKDWAPTTKILVDTGTPTLCTTWTKREAREEEIELDQLGARFIIRPEENKWRSLVPIADFLEGADDEVYYINYYQYMFQGKLGPV